MRHGDDRPREAEERKARLQPDHIDDITGDWLQSVRGGKGTQHIRVLLRGQVQLRGERWSGDRKRASGQEIQA
jgi:hypothetical protein